MPFEFRQVLDVGTSHPIVARLGLQAGDLLKWLDLPKPDIDKITELYVVTLLQRLVRCDQKREEILSQLKAQTERARAAEEKSRMVPHVMQLEESTEAFLYGIKNFLRDLLRLLEIAFDSDLEQASDLGNLKQSASSKATEWAAKQFGKESRIAALLKAHEIWITDAIRFRNAAEHPEGHSGRLIIKNVRRISNQPLQLIPPTWARDPGRPESDMLSDMNVIVANALDLAECLLAETVRVKPTFDKIAIYEISPASRDPLSPIRFRVTLNEEMLGALSKISNDGKTGGP